MIAPNPDAAMWLLSTPNGRQGFFYEEWSGDDPDWVRIQVPATECPRIPARFLEKARRRHPDQYFRQEYLCEFTSADFAYFERDIQAGVLSDRQIEEHILCGLEARLPHLQLIFTRREIRDDKQSLVVRLCLPYCRRSFLNEGDLRSDHHGSSRIDHPAAQRRRRGLLPEDRHAA